MIFLAGSGSVSLECGSVVWYVGCVGCVWFPWLVRGGRREVFPEDVAFRSVPETRVYEFWRHGLVCLLARLNRYTKDQHLANTLFVVNLL